MEPESFIVKVDWQNRHAAHDWAQKNNMQIEYAGAEPREVVYIYQGVDHWRIYGEQNAMMFALRWSV